jgi:hypothetical protein
MMSAPGSRALRLPSGIPTTRLSFDTETGEGVTVYGPVDEVLKALGITNAEESGR